VAGNALDGMERFCDQRSDVGGDDTTHPRAETEIRLPTPWTQRARATVASVLLRPEWAAGPPAPIFPGAVDAVGAGAGVNLVHLAGGQDLALAHVHGLFLQPCIDLEVDRNIDRLPDILTCHGCTVTAHQRGAAGADALREVAAHVHVLDQQCGVAEAVMGIPDRTSWPIDAPIWKMGLIFLPVTPNGMTLSL